MSKISFIREKEIPQSPPPLAEIGIIKWLRENLFSGWFNSLLTIASIYFIFILLKDFIPWVYGAHWTTGSIRECYDINPDVACFSVLSARWKQLLFGLYPAEEYWRPILTFCLLIISIVPILFPRFIRFFWFSFIYPGLAIWLLWGGSFWSVAYIYIGLFVLIFTFPWFGSQRFTNAVIMAFQKSFQLRLPSSWSDFWPASIFLLLFNLVFISLLINLVHFQFSNSVWALLPNGFWLFFETEYLQTFVLQNVVILCTVLIILLVDIYFSVVFLILSYRYYQLGKYSTNQVHATHERQTITSKTNSTLVQLASTLLVCAAFFVNSEVVCNFLKDWLPVSLPFVESLKFGGFTLSLIVGVTGIVASFPMGIILALGRQSDMPLVKMICVGFIEFIRGVPLITLLFVASVLLNYFLPPGTNFDIVLRVIIMVTLFSAAYMAEVIRGGLAGLPVGQHEAADALGLTYWQSQRLIIMPQALKISIPGIVNTFIGLFKDTTLVSIISLLDPVGLASMIRADTKWNGIYWELYIAVGLMFFIVCFGMSQYSQYLERKLKTDN